MQAPVTIVSPVHNGARFIRECIDSVLAQTYTNWEYLIVENCSSDDTYAIATSYAARDSRIKVIKFDNLLPVVPNHNRAFALVPEYSRYCKPLMADDWLFPDCLERMLHAAEAHASIGVVSCYAFDGTFPLAFGYPYPADHVPGLEALKVAMLGVGQKMIVGTPTSLLFRSDLIRKRRPYYYEGNFHSDHETCMDMLTESDFAFVHKNLCLNRLHDHSQTSKHMDRLESLSAHEAFLLHRYGPLCLNEEELQECSARVMNRYYGRLAEQWFRSRDREFWDYHRDNFRRMNLTFSVVPFRQAIGREFRYRLTRHPLSLVRTAIRGSGSGPA